MQTQSLMDIEQRGTSVLTSFFCLRVLPPFDASILAAERGLRHRVRRVPRDSYGDKISRPACTIPSPLIQNPSRRKQADADLAPRPPESRDAAGAARKAVFARNPCDPVRASASRIELVATHDIAIRAGKAPSPRCIPRPTRFIGPPLASSVPASPTFQA
jgi:hypothetical protein